MLEINPQYKVTFLGDYFDQGPHMIKSIIGITTLHKKFKDRVFIILGNRDITKLRIPYELTHSISQSDKVWNTWQKPLSNSELYDTSIDPMKKIQVLLNKGVNKLGKRGDLVDVAPGYARNYLIPTGSAILATPGVVRQVEQRQEKERQRILAEKQAAQARKTALETIGRFILRKQMGENEAIFGTVTTQDVAEAIKKMTNQEIDRRTITIPDINKIGFYQAEVKLHPEVLATIEIQVAPL